MELRVRRSGVLAGLLVLLACDDADSGKVSQPSDAGEQQSDAASGDASTDAATTDATAPHDANGPDAKGPDASADEQPFRWNLPQGFPEPVVPRDNPMTEAKVELGRRLFYDKRLSGNESQSCASCHKQALAFSDGRATALGSTGEPHPRGSMSLVNLAYAASLTWANPLFAIGVLPEPLERQTQLPLYGDAPIELGLKAQSQPVERLAGVALYRALFAAAFPEDPEPINASNIGRALAAFERVLISGDSAYDRYVHGDKAALSDAQKRGQALFAGERLQCSQCHSGFNLTEHVHWQGKPEIELRYRNTGLYNLDSAGAYPAPNTGTFDVTMEPSDMGKFKVPTLRNVALTAPYMHDGSIASLSEVIDHYAAGGRTIAAGPNRGVGRDSPLKDPLIHGFELTDDERKDLLAFLESLTDSGFVANPAFADPWTQSDKQ
ncbi:MAG TPA: di-heme enzyme [Polyangiales bacterium]|nr:di-heme enzyme [Polyangiales bacterium]